MFNWFKKKSKPGLTDWNIGDVSAFEKIVNPDSVQYIDEKSGKSIYFSILSVAGGGPLQSSIALNKPSSVTKDENGWTVKGTNMHENQVLVCVISVNRQDDIEWAMDYFNALKPMSLT